MQDLANVIADVRDGLTPTCRQALYVLHEMQQPVRRYVKSSTIAEALSLRDLIKHYVEHQSDVVARLTGHRSDQRILEIVKDDLRSIAAHHGDERRTAIG